MGVDKNHVPRGTSLMLKKSVVAVLMSGAHRAEVNSNGKRVSMTAAMGLMGHVPHALHGASRWVRDIAMFSKNR